ncbi:MAG: hypothetical protein EXR52_01510 [Dehalococcoidia bacterium]|nr:hypothetical protein [Dehalococcoidia bacterium]
MASLSHTDGVLLFGILLVATGIVAVATRQLTSVSRLARFGVALLVPWTAAVGLFVAVFFLVNETWEIGLQWLMRVPYGHFEAAYAYDPLGLSQLTNRYDGLLTVVAGSRRL